jgi:glycosyltransferase involved in cell wall biosynthesis
MQPKVSILLPNRNGGRFLREAIASALEQDFTDFELIISDNASMDDSASLIRELAGADSRIHFTLQPQDLGMVGNFNWCLAQARGEYIKFLLADDKLAHAEALSRLVRLLDQQPQVVLASSAARIINERSESQGVRDYWRRDVTREGTAVCRRCLLAGLNVVGEPSLVLFRRRCAGRGFNPSYQHWVDVEFALRVLEQGSFAYCAEPLAAFRVHADQQTRQHHKQQLHITEYLRLLEEFEARPWLGRGAAVKAARRKLFEEVCHHRKRCGHSAALPPALAEPVARFGLRGYTAFVLRRKLWRPFENLRHGLQKRLGPAGG